MSQAKSPERVVQEIRRKTRRQFSAEEKIRIVLEGLRGEESIAALCRREGLNPNLYYRWSKEFLEAGKKRLVGDTTREATSTEVTDLRSANGRLKDVVAELVLENRLLKKGWRPPTRRAVRETHRGREVRAHPVGREIGVARAPDVAGTADQSVHVLHVVSPLPPARARRSRAQPVGGPPVLEPDSATGAAAGRRCGAGGSRTVTAEAGVATDGSGGPFSLGIECLSHSQGV